MIVASVRIKVTPEMLDAAQSAVPLAITNEELIAIYKAMRSLEPGPADEGVPQMAGVSPYAGARG